MRTLLELGADPNYGDHAGFPALIAALSSDRADRYELLELLLSFGADPGQRGLNDWTPLHYAAASDDTEGIELLLARGADPTARTRIDDFATPLEELDPCDPDRSSRGAGHGKPQFKRNSGSAF